MMPIGSYGRLGPGGQRLWHVGSGQADVILLVDLVIPDPSTQRVEALADLFRTAPAELAGYTSIVACRWPLDLGLLADPEGPTEPMARFGEALRATLDRLGWPTTAALVTFPIGRLPLLWPIESHGGLSSPNNWDPREAARARSAEVQALLARGRAVWRPSGYHYRLPSGTHSDTFVRLADAIRSPEDALALASWLAWRWADKGLSALK